MMTQQAVPVAFSGSIPPNYDNFLGPLFFEPFAIDIAQRLHYLRPTALLEVAAGTGRVTKHLPDVLPADAKIVATDINPAMVDFARKHLQANKTIEWDVVDAVALPYPDHQFDCIVSQFGVMFYSDRNKAYKEAYRVLQPGGVFLFNAWDHIHRNPTARLTDEVLEHFFPTNTPAFYKIPFSYHDANQIRSELESAGFEIASMQILKMTGYAATAEDAASGLLEGTPVYTAIVERDAALLPVMKKTLADDLAVMFGKEDLHVPLQARIVMAVKK
ncbi:MAG TPA: methyltransferase domain-containing protein [Saprospiraceae bacterium]|nr:methyltransferase domain-containing protein [Saprospiraceae bacterium]